MKESTRNYRFTLSRTKTGCCAYPGRHQPMRALLHVKFLKGKLFRPTCSFKVRGAWNTGQLLS